MGQIGVITEQGDLGLGYDPVENEEDQQALQEQLQEKQDRK